jgi:hypothetical protein
MINRIGERIAPAMAAKPHGRTRKIDMVKITAPLLITADIPAIPPMKNRAKKGTRVRWAV